MITLPIASGPLMEINEEKSHQTFLPLVLLKPAIDQLEVSALLTFDGRVRAYHGCNG